MLRLYASVGMKTDKAGMRTDKARITKVELTISHKLLYAHSFLYPGVKFYIGHSKRNMHSSF